MVEKVNAAEQLSGLVPTANLGSGTASSSTFLRGDQTYAAPGGGVTGSTTPTSGDAAEWDSNLNLSANNLLTPLTAISTATTTTLTMASNQIQVFTGSSGSQTYVLPSTCPAGTTFWFFCASSGGSSMQVESSLFQGLGGGLNVGAFATATALVANPTTAVQWQWNAPALPSASNSWTAQQIFYATLKMQSTTLSTSLSGLLEYDGTALYASPANSTRAVWDVEQLCTLTTAYSFTTGGSNALHQLFNATTNGAVTLPLGTYFFECMFNLTSIAATSAAIGFGFGGTFAGSQLWEARVNRAAAATEAATTATTMNTATNSTLCAANTTGTGWGVIRGKVVVTTAGTLIPSMSLGASTLAVTVGVGSFFRIWTAGISTVTTTGNWS